VFDAVAHLLDPEVDLIFFDTTSTYFDFEIEQPDDPFGVTSTNASSTLTSTRSAPTAATVCAGGGGDGASGVPHLWEVEGLPRRPPAGGSRDGRDSGRDPGAGVVLAGQHLRLPADPPSQGRPAGLDARKRRLGRRPRLHLEGQPAPPVRRGDGYILGEKLRSGSPEAAAAMARQGRYQDVTANVRVKEVNISEHERFGVCTTPMRRA
jgi:hypothetical protein